jgi:ribosome recycling factor
MVDEAIELAKDGMEAALEHLRAELGRVRAGRANPALLDSVKVESYGTRMPLNQVATVAVGDARLLVVKPYDRNTITAIEKAINSAALGLNANSDGIVVRVPIPALTEERRRQLSKRVRDLGEEAKIAVRQARRDANDLLKDAEKAKDISKDDLKRGLDSVQQVTDDFTTRVEGVVEKKENEILEG